MTNTTRTALSQLTTEPGYRLKYILPHEAYYADAWRKGAGNDPALTVVKSADAGGCAWEFQIKDYRGRLGQPAVQVRVFEDAFPAFVELAPFFAALAERKPSRLAEVRELLDNFGFVDATQRVEPAG